MLDKKRSSHRLSSLLSLGSNHSDQPDGASVASSESSSRLSKVKNRISSATHLAPNYPPPGPPNAQLSKLTIQPVESAPAALNNANLEPPPPLSAHSPRSAPGSRSASPARPRSSAGLHVPDGADSKLKKLKRKSGLFSSAQSSDERLQDVGGVSRGTPGDGPLAWIVGHRGKVPYNLAYLINGERVPELWDEEGDTLVYLFPRIAGVGPSFRVDSSVYAASQYMTRLVHGRLYSDPHMRDDRGRRDVSGATFPPSRPDSPDQSIVGSSDGSKGSRALSDATEDDRSEKHLYLPIRLSTDSAPISPGSQQSRLTTKDIDTLVAYRNFVAFLMGQSLVATPRHSDIFDVFMRIADILQHYQFSNLDGTTYGEVAASSFDCYVDELGLADVRHSREKTIEAVVLGEHLRSMALYTEGFVHAAGKLDHIKDLQHPKWDLVSHKTATRLARASMDLEARIQNTKSKLADFEFPAIFSGIMNSDTADEKKAIRFKYWRSAFGSCRSFAMDYYKSKYGSWLPKAKSKKNNLTTSGLNRIVLLDLYHEFSNLYDLLVDRTNLTTRTADGFLTEDEGTDFEHTVYRAMRKVLSEYDRSTPPVQPPIPFDLPLYPTLAGARGDYPSGDAKKDAKARSKKLKSDDIARMLRQSHNADSERQTPFLDAFRAFEQKHAHGCTMEELWEMRSGHWLFIYAVIQSLPMLVMDAPGIRFTEGVEYFLCQPPRSGVPWGRDDTTRSRTWFGVAGGSHVVSLPTDIVEHGVEGVFRRSHGWKMAERWSANDAMLNAAVQETIDPAPLPPPPGLLNVNPDPAGSGAVGAGSDAASASGSASGHLRPRSQSPAGASSHSRRESVMNLGLEALPLPAGMALPGGSPLAGGLGAPPGGAVLGGLPRPQSSNDPSKTFDAILSSAELGPNGGERKKDRKKK